MNGFRVFNYLLLRCYRAHQILVLAERKLKVYKISQVFRLERSRPGIHLSPLCKIARVAKLSSIIPIASAWNAMEIKSSYHL
jgi:hypothetical protein